ncbi:hypothetical protein Taro_004918 [Colocasia esculenta]|uniref:JmjC domain-containing protein n=1 Tax=Colocasia esculenta TaxID=4460 RepID=A0A843TWE7_COLES|nr:hypothetical protein [Colocasia esculenta]
MGVTIGGQIERVNGKELHYKEFAERYLRRNQPVLLTGLMEGWRACDDWVAEDGLFNLDFFSTHFGNSRVQLSLGYVLFPEVVHAGCLTHFLDSIHLGVLFQHLALSFEGRMLMVADCSRKEFTDQKRIEMSVLEFIAYWHSLSAGNSGNYSSQDMDPQPLLYLKDWHFIKEFSGYLAYTTSPFFIDDWLNLYLDSYSMHQDSSMQQRKNEQDCSDYRFVYMGPKGTWTPLHADVFRSYSWSGNVCGRKHWYLLPPSQCHLLFDRHQRNSVYDIFDEVSEKKFPGFMQEDTVSINHNWFNGYNLSFVWNLLLKDYSEAKDYIEDIRDICDNFELLCQRNLAANTGMNFYDFFMFIIRFTLASFALLYHLKEEGNSTFRSSSKVKQLIFNLGAIYNVAKNMESVEAFTEVNLRALSGEDWYALTDINRITGEDRFHEFTMAIYKAYELTDEPQEKGLSLSSTSPCPSACLSPSCFGKLCFLQAHEAKICCPTDLVGLIEHFLKDPDGIFGALDAHLFQELDGQISSFFGY